MIFQYLSSAIMSAQGMLVEISSSCVYILPLAIEHLKVYNFSFCRIQHELNQDLRVEYACVSNNRSFSGLLLNSKSNFRKITFQRLHTINKNFHIRVRFKKFCSFNF